MKKIIFCILIFALISSCCKRTIGVTKTITIRDTTTITLRERILDTIIQADTITNTIQLECDSNNKVRIIHQNKTEGKRSSLNAFLNTDGRLDVKSICNELTLQLVAKDSIIERLREVNTEIKEVVEHKKGFWGNIGVFIQHLIYTLIVLIIGGVLGKFIKI